MPSLTGKTILILSPQSWGTMFLLKHHYAAELGKRGNKVYFLNPPDEKAGKAYITVQASGVNDNLFLINHRLFFPYRLKFHALPLFHLLMKFHLKKILRKIPAADIIWSFDLGYLYPLKFFPSSSYKIFHPADEPLNQSAINAARGAQIIFSVTHEILTKYKKYQVPLHFINHGLAQTFLMQETPVKNPNEKIHTGISGNLIRKEIDWEVQLQIVTENPDVIFDFWGSYNYKQSNIGGGGDAACASFIEQLKQLPNVVLHGPISTNELAKQIQNADIFLICYDVVKDQSKGTNYHKVMEFISTGKVIVSNNITTYSRQPQLVQMVEEREHNKSLPALFKKVVNNLAEYNSPALQLQRKSFAADNTYTKQIERIEAIIYAA